MGTMRRTPPTVFLTLALSPTCLKMSSLPCTLVSVSLWHQRTAQFWPLTMHRSSKMQWIGQLEVLSMQSRIKGNVALAGPSPQSAHSKVHGRFQLAPCTPWLSSSWWTVIAPTMDAVVVGHTLPMTAISLAQDTALKTPTDTQRVMDRAKHPLAM